MRLVLCCLAALLAGCASAPPPKPPRPLPRVLLVGSPQHPPPAELLDEVRRALRGGSFPVLEDGATESPEMRVVCSAHGPEISLRGAELATGDVYGSLNFDDGRARRARLQEFVTSLKKAWREG